MNKRLTERAWFQWGLIGLGVLVATGISWVVLAIYAGPSLR